VRAVFEQIRRPTREGPRRKKAPALAEAETAERRFGADARLAQPERGPGVTSGGPPLRIKRPSSG